MKTIITWAISIVAVIIVAFGIRYGSMLSDKNVGTYENLSSSSTGLKTKEDERPKLRIGVKFSLNLEGMSNSYNDGDFKGVAQIGESGINCAPKKGITDYGKDFMEKLQSKDKKKVPKDADGNPITGERNFLMKGSVLVDDTTNVPMMKNGDLVSGKMTNCTITVGFSNNSTDKILYDDSYIYLNNKGSCKYVGSYTTSKEKVQYEYFGKYEFKDDVIYLSLTSGYESVNGKKTKLAEEHKCAFYVDEEAGIYTGVYKKR